MDDKNLPDFMNDEKFKEKFKDIKINFDDIQPKPILREHQSFKTPKIKTNIWVIVGTISAIVAALASIVALFK